MMIRHIVIPIFVPHKGCPYDCIYCNQKTISGQTADMTEEKMRMIIDSHLGSVDGNHHIEIGFYGGSFTGIEKEHQIKLLQIASEYINKGKVKEVRLSTRPDYINEEILDYLEKYNVKTIELGVQSLDDSILSKSCRGHTSEIVFKSSRLIKQFGFNLGIQTMIGLPEDEKDKDIYTAKKVIEISPKVVRIYPTLVIKGTYLEKMYEKGEYTPLNLDEAVDICSDLLEMYQNSNIKVLRIGLQPTETINEGSDVIAGPFHPAFRQLVESKLMLKKVEKQIIEKKFENRSEIEIAAAEKFVSNVIGQKRTNIEYLKKKYNYEDIKVKVDNSIQNDVRVEGKY